MQRAAREDTLPLARTRAPRCSPECRTGPPAAAVQGRRCSGKGRHWSVPRLRCQRPGPPPRGKSTAGAVACALLFPILFDTHVTDTFLPYHRSPLPNWSPDKTVILFSASVFPTYCSQLPSTSNWFLLIKVYFYTRS